MNHRDLLDPKVLREVDDVCRKFSSGWKSGRRPPIARFLGRQEEPIRSALLRELLLIDLAFRRKAGEQPIADDYLRQFPADAGTIAAAFSESDTAVSQMLADTMPPGGEGQPRAAGQPAADSGTLPLESFIGSLTGSGLMTPAEVQEFILSLPAEKRPSNGKQLAEELHRQKKLTRFQAQTVYQGKTRGLVVGNYVVLDRLGKGGMGQVYRARHRKMEREVAIKMLSPAAAGSKELVTRFQREAKAVAKLSHPNIVAAYDADEDKGLHFLVMEYVKGQDLAAVVNERGPLPVLSAVDCVMQTARGLQYAHSAGVIHRDIKPHNLLLDQDGIVRILDLGLARIDSPLAGTAAAESLTESGAVMGTLDFLPPEQALDAKHADARSDIYSLGCTLYYLLTGRPLYPGDTPAQKIVAHRTLPIPSLRTVRPDVPPALDAACRKMLAKDPQERQQTMAEVLKDIERCAAESPQTSEASLLPETISFDSAPKPAVTPPPREAKKPVPTGTPSAAGRWLTQRGAIGAAAATCMAMVFLLAFLMSRSRDGRLVVELEESDAEVSVSNADGQLVAMTTSARGSAVLPVPPGRHQLKIRKLGFEDMQQELTMEVRGRVVVPVQLRPERPVPGTLVVHVSESTALVELLDEQNRVLETFRSSEQDLLVPVPPGKYCLRAEKAGFVPVAAEVTAEAKGRHEMVLRLEKPAPLPATLAIKASEPDAQVDVLDRQGVILGTHRTGAGPLSIPLPAGAYRVRVSKLGFTTDGCDVALQAGETQTYEIRLVPAAPPPAVASAPTAAPTSGKTEAPTGDMREKAAVPGTASSPGEAAPSAAPGPDAALATSPPTIKKVRRSILPSALPKPAILRRPKEKKWEPALEHFDAILWDGEPMQLTYRGQMEIQEQILGPIGVRVEGLAFHPDGRIVYTSREGFRNRSGRGGGFSAGGADNFALAFWSPGKRTEPVCDISFRTPAKGPGSSFRPDPIAAGQGIFPDFDGYPAFDREGTCWFSQGTHSGPNYEQLYKVVSVAPVSIERLAYLDTKTHWYGLQIPPFDDAHLYTIERQYGMTGVQEVVRYPLEPSSNPVEPEPWLSVWGKDVSLCRALALTPTRAILSFSFDLRVNERRFDAKNRKVDSGSRTFLLDREAKAVWLLAYDDLGPLAVSWTGGRVIRQVEDLSTPRQSVRAIAQFHIPGATND